MNKGDLDTVGKIVGIWDLNQWEIMLVIKNTSFLVDRLEDDSSKWEFSNDIKEYYKVFSDDLLIEVFDFIREDEEFKLIIEQ